jgi:hypothetical protein
MRAGRERYCGRESQLTHKHVRVQRALTVPCGPQDTTAPERVP